MVDASDMQTPFYTCLARPFMTNQRNATLKVSSRLPACASRSSIYNFASMMEAGVLLPLQNRKKTKPACCMSTCIAAEIPAFANTSFQSLNESPPMAPGVL